MDTKTALLNSAENSARSYGYDGFSYADLAADVGIRKASIHHHFPTKATLAVSLMKRYNEDLTDKLMQIFAENDTGARQLNEVFKHYRAALKDGNSLCLCIAFSISRDHLDQEIVTELSAFRKNSIKWLTAIFELGQTDGTISNVMNPAVEAKSCLAVLEGAQLAARAEKDTDIFDAAIQTFLMRIKT